MPCLIELYLIWGRSNNDSYYSFFFTDLCWAGCFNDCLIMTVNDDHCIVTKANGRITLELL